MTAGNSRENKSQRIVSQAQQQLKPSSCIPYLQLICACAEFFPDGECWSSSVSTHTKSYYCSQSFSSSFHTTYKACCCTSDLTTLLHLLSQFLIWCGGSNGNVDVQVWTLMSLCKLTESFSLFARNKTTTSTANNFVVEAWQNVWHILFRSDLRYASYTIDSYPSSVGELVLMLLSEMVVSGCCVSVTSPHSTLSTTATAGISIATKKQGGNGPVVNPTQNSNNNFVRMNQCQVWQLPVFEQINNVQSVAVCDLLKAILEYSGLLEENAALDDNKNNFDDLNQIHDILMQHRRRSESNSQDINNSNNSKTNDNYDNVITSSRRYKLLCFCLVRLFTCISKSNSNKNENILFDDNNMLIFAALNQSIASLVSGNQTSLSTDATETCFSRHSLGLFGCTVDSDLAPCMKQMVSSSSSSSITPAHHGEIFGNSTKNCFKRNFVSLMWKNWSELSSLSATNFHEYDDNEHIWRILHHQSSPRLNIPYAYPTRALFSNDRDTNRTKPSDFVAESTRASLCRLATDVIEEIMINGSSCNSSDSIVMSDEEDEEREDENVILNNHDDADTNNNSHKLLLPEELFCLKTFGMLSLMNVFLAGNSCAIDIHNSSSDKDLCLESSSSFSSVRMANEIVAHFNTHSDLFSKSLSGIAHRLPILSDIRLLAFMLRSTFSMVCVLNEVLVFSRCTTDNQQQHHHKNNDQNRGERKVLLSSEITNAISLVYKSCQQLLTEYPFRNQNRDNVTATTTVRTFSPAITTEAPTPSQNPRHYNNSSKRGLTMSQATTIPMSNNKNNDSDMDSDEDNEKQYDESNDRKREEQDNRRSLYNNDDSSDENYGFDDDDNDDSDRHGLSRRSSQRHSSYSYHGSSNIRNQKRRRRISSKNAKADTPQAVRDDGFASRKRQLRQKYSNKATSFSSIALNTESARLLSSIIAILKPSVDSCQKIADALVWPTESDFFAHKNKEHRRRQKQQQQQQLPLQFCEALPQDTMVCAELFLNDTSICRQQRLLRNNGNSMQDDDEQEEDEEEDNEETIIFLCTQIITAGRHLAGRSGAYNMFGYNSIARMIEIRKQLNRHKCNTEQVSKISSIAEKRDLEDLVNFLDPGGGGKNSNSSGNPEQYKSQKRSLKYCPHIRASRLVAATKAFACGGSTFRELFSSRFPLMVMDSLCDLDHGVRRAAVDAIGVTLQLLPNQEGIVEEVLNVLAPLPLTSDIAEINKAFHSWIEERVGCVSKEPSEMELKCWDDCRTSLESCAIDTLGIIVGTTTDPYIAREKLFYLIELAAHRPDLMCCCYRACNNAAYLSGFTSVKNMMYNEQEWLLQCWFQSGLDLYQLPLLCSSPDVLDGIRDRGNCGDIVGSYYNCHFSKIEAGSLSLSASSLVPSLPTENHSPILDMEKLQKDVVVDFLWSTASTFIPISIMHALSIDHKQNLGNNSGKPNNDKHDEDDFHGKRDGGEGASTSGMPTPVKEQKEQGWKYFQEASIILARSPDDEDVDSLDMLQTKIVRGHLHDIVAFAYPMLQQSCFGEGDHEEETCSNDEIAEDIRWVQFLGKEMLTIFLQKYLSQDRITTQTQKSAHKIVIGILKLGSKRASIFGQDQSSLQLSAYSDAIAHFARDVNHDDCISCDSYISGSSSEAGMLLESAGSCATECILHANKWLESCCTHGEKERSMDIIIMIVKGTVQDSIQKESKKSQKMNNSQLGFCLHVILAILLNQHYCDLRVPLLELLQHILTSVMSLLQSDNDLGILEEVNANALNKIVVSLILVHEEAHQQYFKWYHCQELIKEIDFHRSIGFPLDEDITLSYTSSNNRTKHTGVWGWDFVPDSSTPSEGGGDNAISDKVIKLMTISYDLMYLILIESPEQMDTSLLSLDPFPEMREIRQSDDSNNLAEENRRRGTQMSLLPKVINPKFSLRSIYEQYDKRFHSSLMKSLQDEMDSFLVFCERSAATKIAPTTISNMDPMCQKNDQSCYQTPSTTQNFVGRSQLMCLSHLQVVLRHYRDNNTIKLNSSNDGKHNKDPTNNIRYDELINRLCSFFQPDIPNEIQYLASSCLGELGNCYNLIETSSSNFSSRLVDNSALTNVVDTNNALLQFQMRALDLLSQYLQSESATTALTAMETVLCMSCTAEAKLAWKFLDDDSAAKRILRPFFATKKKRNKKNPLLSSSFIQELHRLTGLTSREMYDAKKGDDNLSWCWNDKIWACPTNGAITYERWVRNVVCSLIHCCFGRALSTGVSSSDKVGNAKIQATERTEDDNIPISLLVRGKSTFFSLCLKMSSIAPDFASEIFPGIIYDLLAFNNGNHAHDPNSASSDEEEDNTKDTVRDQVLRDTALGTSYSAANRQISRCFNQNMLRPSCHSKTANVFLVDCDPRATELAIDTLNFLRIETQKRFQSSRRHKKNRLSLPNRVYDDQASRQQQHLSAAHSDSNCNDWNAGLDPSPVWRGVPYGVTLRISGIDLALACCHARRFASALYYVDMYSDNELGGSGEILEHISANLANKGHQSVKNARYDISGFGDRDKSSGSTALVDRAALVKNVLKRCFVEMREVDGQNGVDVHAYALQFQKDSCDQSMNNIPDNTTSLNGGNFRTLVKMDSKLQPKLGMKSSFCQYDVAVASSLENLGLRYLLQHYLSSIDMKNLAVGSSQDRKLLQEKWQENGWRMMQWDKNLLQHTHQSNFAEIFLTNEVLTPPSAIHRENRGSKIGAYSTSFKVGHFRPHQPTIETSNPGFHESLRSFFLAIQHGDSDNYSLKLNQARAVLLSEVYSLIGTESMTSSITDYTTKFQVLNDLNDLSICAIARRPINDVLCRWGFGSSQELNELSYDDHKVTNTSLHSNISSFKSEELVLSIREVALKVLPSRLFPKQFGPIVALSLHLKKFCSIAIERGRPDVADGCLERLHQIMKVRKTQNDAGIFDISTMKLKLVEAKIMKCHNESSDAIRCAKLIIGHLQREKIERDERTSNIKDMVSDVDSLLSEALRNCGDWMTKYKVESGKSVLSNYLIPASLLAKSVYDKRCCSSSARSAVDAMLTMAGFVANLYDNVLERVNSQEWKMSGIAALQRKQELETCENMFRESREKMMAAKSSRKKSKGRNSASPKQNKLSMAQQEAECIDIHAHMRTLQKEVEMDAKERSAVEKSIGNFLLLAIKNYENALNLSDSSFQDMDQHVFRMVSLWFENSHNSAFSKEVNLSMGNASQTVPSYRFVPLTYQLFSRIDEEVDNKKRSSFQTALRAIVIKICIDHPYHGLVQLIALSNGKNVGSGVSGRQSNTYLENVKDSKVEATKDILNDICKKEKLYQTSNHDSSRLHFISELVASYTALTDSYIQLAMAPTQQFQSGGRQLTKDIALSLVNRVSGRGVGSSNLQTCLGKRGTQIFKHLPCIITRPPTLQPNGDYTDLIGSELIASFDPTFSLTETGLHRPKIIICRGGDGRKYKQLVKGEDDIRQDAVMEQIFFTVNKMLRKKNDNYPGQQKGSDTVIARELKIATYNIIPLSPASGVLEWVDDTIPFGDYLLDKGGGSKATVGAHSRYYPGEWGNSLCRSHLRCAPPQSKREAFDEICRHFSPAFRFFFLERFSFCPQQWHNARMLYTRSCAVSSIVGHVLGIGDRHSHNILINEKTGEVVHIDFGIVFEQGKLLTSPETIPFRLTRDIVDGFGPCGTEGIFSCAAERTMLTLRENANPLLTILSAVVSDPLYKWSVSPVKALQKQRDDRNVIVQGSGKSSTQITSSDDDENDAARRAISKIKEKLQGYEDGTGGESQSVEGQVRLLINAARDRDNLCALYFGWCPWL